MFALKKQQLKEQVRQPSIPVISFSEIADMFNINIIDVVRAKPIMNMVEKDNILKKKWLVNDGNEPLFNHLLKHDQRFVFRHLCKLDIMGYISFNGIDLVSIFADKVIEMKDGEGVIEMFSDPSLPAELRCDALIKAYDIMIDENEFKYMSAFKWFCMKIIHSILPNVSMDEIHYCFYNCFDAFHYNDDCIMSPTLAKKLGEIFGCDVNVYVFEKDFDPSIPLSRSTQKDGYIDGLRFCMKDIFYDNLMLLLLTRDDQEVAVIEYVQRNIDVINPLFNYYPWVFPKKIRSIINQFIADRISPSFKNRIGTMRKWDTDAMFEHDFEGHDLNEVGKEWLRMERRIEMVNTINDSLFMDDPQHMDEPQHMDAIRKMDRLIKSALDKFLDDVPEQPIDS